MPVLSPIIKMINRYGKHEKRKFGSSRKVSTEIRVDNWKKDKDVNVKFLGANGYCLTKDKVYQVIETKLISNNDEAVNENRRKAEKNKNIIGCWGHCMPWYFRIKNDNGKIRSFPQQLFALVGVSVGGSE